MQLGRDLGGTTSAPVGLAQERGFVTMSSLKPSSGSVFNIGEIPGKQKQEPHLHLMTSVFFHRNREFNFTLRAFP